MTDAFAFWFGRLFANAHLEAPVSPGEPKSMKIEVERLPDYLWRDLGFQQPRRSDE